MTDSEPDAVGEDEPQPELCDQCGAMIDDGSELYAVVRDSSVIHAHDPKLDGGRMIVACSPEHLRDLQKQYRKRPFIDAELWAGKIYRAMDAHPDGLSREELEEETGLTPAQIELGVLWQNLGALRWHQQFGQGDDEAP
ncbi:hypothetical protein [Streptomyces sp. MBT53]|uniref:hypothetical protein n=1 Tax=Streptomyces sp. MBT53 TaxID=1488384 RepID=UPI00191398F8|nr:hypothetical protein [Streptomyces sp. MBT53]MBK6017593.1 hypothetical protein [Streptomyces sp. MBT53]